MVAQAERVLSQRELNRALLARQLLLERSPLPVPRALERIGGIQNQYAPNAYVRLWSMLVGFRREDLTRAYEDGSVVQGTLMRLLPCLNELQVELTSLETEEPNLERVFLHLTGRGLRD